MFAEIHHQMRINQPATSGQYNTEKAVEALWPIYHIDCFDAQQYTFFMIVTSLNIYLLISPLGTVTT